MALAGGLIFDLAGREESQQNGPSGAVRIFVFSHMCPSPLHAFVMPARLNPVLAQGAWRVANVAKKDMRGLVKGCGARLSSKEPLLSSPPPAMAGKLPSAPCPHQGPSVWGVGADVPALAATTPNAQEWLENLPAKCFIFSQRRNRKLVLERNEAPRQKTDG